jgi:hypothetical protein
MTGAARSAQGVARQRPPRAAGRRKNARAAAPSRFALAQIGASAHPFVERFRQKAA